MDGTSSKLMNPPTQGGAEGIVRLLLNKNNPIIVDLPDPIKKISAWHPTQDLKPITTVPTKTTKVQNC